MSVPTIEPIPPAWPSVAPLPTLDQGSSPVGFEQLVLREVSNVNGQLAAADANLQALASGKADNLHEAMLSMEQARLSFQFLAQVRNRFLDAYQQLMQMQI
jgi:flagellar hook-basal body complex protein FliE